MWTYNIDEIFIINTPAEKKRMILAMGESAEHRLWAKRYEATIHDDGAKGLSQTMYKLFRESKGKTLLVLEDDFKFIRAEVNDVPEVMDKVMEQLPAGWDCLYLGCNLLTPPEKVTDNILRVRAAYSSHAVLYSPKGIDLILSLWDEEEKPYDNFLMQKIQPYGNCYCTFPMLCSQRKGVSSIFEYKPNMIGMERYYDTGTKEIDWGLMMEDRFKEFTVNL